jgi:tripartite-type tricarboxylate transporter receptor subunit TctC
MNLKVTAMFAAILSCASAHGAPALYEYPTGPVRMIVAGSPGDPNDLLARMIAPGLTRFFRQRFIVDNHAAGNGNIAAVRVAKAAGDGHTLLVVSAVFATSVSIYPSLAYRPQRDFTPVSRLASFHHVLVVNSRLQANTLADFLTLLRAEPGRIAIASAGTGTTSHLAAELMKIRAGWLNALHVPYKGNGPALANLLGNHVDAHVATVMSAQPHVQTGRLKALAVTTPKRLPELADVPTFSEAGFPGFEAPAWTGIVAPAGTPYDTVVRLNLSIAQVMSEPVLRQRFAIQGAVPVHETPAQFGDFLGAEIEKWAKVVKASGPFVE